MIYELTFTKNGRTFTELFRFKRAAEQAKATVTSNGYTQVSLKEFSGVK